MYPTTHERKECDDNRCWPTQTPASESVDHCRRYSGVSVALAPAFSLSFGALVWLARLFLSLLVRLQSQTRTLRDFYSPYGVTTQRDIPAVSTTLRRAGFREPDDHSQQPAGSVFTREIHSPAGLGCVNTGRADLRFSTQG